MEKNAWERVSKKAKGEKVRDDPKLLRKTLKREQAQKKKSTREWKQRTTEVQDRMNRKQKRRDANVARYIQRKKDYRMGKPAKVS